MHKIDFWEEIGREIGWAHTACRRNAVLIGCIVELLASQHQPICRAEILRAIHQHPALRHVRPSSVSRVLGILRRGGGARVIDQAWGATPLMRERLKGIVFTLRVLGA